MIMLYITILTIMFRLSCSRPVYKFKFNIECLVSHSGEYTVYVGGQQPNQQTSASSNHLIGKFDVATSITSPTTKTKF